MKENKIKATTEFREWLIANDINFMENPSNYGQFKIWDGKNKESLATVWSTTELLVTNEPPERQIRVRGMKKIQQVIANWYEVVSGANSIRTAFDAYAGKVAYARKLITVTELPSGALEVQINDSDLSTKYAYIAEKYDDQMRLKTCPDIIIRDFIIV